MVYRGIVQYLDRNKVGLAFISNSFGEKSFTATWRSVEQDTFGRVHSELQEFFRVFDGVLY